MRGQAEQATCAEKALSLSCTINIVNRLRTPIVNQQIINKMYLTLLSRQLSPDRSNDNISDHHKYLFATCWLRCNVAPPTEGWLLFPHSTSTGPL